MDIAFSVGGSVLSAFFQVLFDRMAKPEFLDLFRKLKLEDSILEKLNWKLLILQAVLEDAENKQTKNAAVRKWLDQLQENLYQADDLLDQINTEALRVKVESQYQSSQTNRVSASTDTNNFSVQFLKEIMPKLEEIVHKLDDFEQKIGILGLVKEVEPKKQPSFRFPSTSLVENDECGRDDDKEKIIQNLVSDDGNSGNVTVISIVGLGGIGKTTLAKLAYNDERVNKEFDKKAWVCISEEYDAIRITKSLLNELHISFFDPNETFNSLQLKLKEGLSEKKFLLVLDDIWNRNYNEWLSLSAPFSCGKEGSRIILTTRDETIALMMGNQHIHHLNPMSEEHCWSLFQKHALYNRVVGRNLEFESIGKEIVKKCGGLPLAVKAVAGLLRSKETIEEWNEILRSDEWDQSDSILPSLRLSYNHLSSHLKRCFGYCAVFHKDYEFVKDEVISLWMANDLLERPPRNKRFEDVGDEFFRELRLRSLFQQTSDGKFSMHDLVNDLAKFVSGKHFLRLENDWQQKDSLIVARHFSYTISYYDAFEKFKSLELSKLLRTFLPIDFQKHLPYSKRSLSKRFLGEILPTSKFLRVLSLSGYKFTELPDSLSNLEQLRFLDLSRTRIRGLPSWICRFYNLQTLLLTYCRFLKQFPQDMEKLVNLRHLDLSDVPLTKMPLKIGRLENIQYLSTFIVSKENDSRIEELGRLCNLRGEFNLSGLENVTSGKDAILAKMKDKKYIKKLTLEWNADCEDSQIALEVLENLQPHENIEHLEIRGYCGTRFPDWFQDTSLCHLRNLQISECKNCFCLPAVENRKSFSCLEELCIKNCPMLIEGIPKHIPSLKKLVISGCSGLVNSEGELTILESEADFSFLVELEISNMPDLKELSSAKLGLNKLLPCLKVLSIDACAGLMSFNLLPTTLESLEIKNCGNLELETQESTQSCHVSFGSNRKLLLNLFPNLLQLWLNDMEDLSFSIPLGNQNLNSLRSLDIMRCQNLALNGALSAPHLTKILLEDCPKLKSLPERMCTLLPSLRVLIINDCPEIERFPEGGLPSSLRSLKIGGSERLWGSRGEWGLERLPFLGSFYFGGRQQQEWLLEDLLLPSTLTSLFLEGNQNMKTLDCAVLQQFTCLEDLFIWYFPQLRSLQGATLPATLSRLSIYECPFLKERLEWEKGEDWPKVAHIPFIKVDCEFIP